MEYLKQWLKDSDSDKHDHLQLKFPSNCNAFNNQESIIRCSLIERVLSPNQDFKLKYFLVSF